MFNEKPPMLSGNSRADLISLRDYLFRLAGSLEAVATAGTDSGSGTAMSYTKDGKQVFRTMTTEQQIRENAKNLQALIIKTANDIKQYADSKTEEYNQLYVAQSDFGTFQEEINTTIESTALGVLEDYGYNASISYLQDTVGQLQEDYTVLNGQIRRGIVLDPDTGSYVLGIAISQEISFTGAVCDAEDVNNPHDGYDYYYISEGQTFGLYTASGWQFWINGHKKGWYSSYDGMLHVANILVENTLQIGSKWELVTTRIGLTDEYDLDLRYLGG